MSLQQTLLFIVMPDKAPALYPASLRPGKIADKRKALSAMTVWGKGGRDGQVRLRLSKMMAAARLRLSR